MKNSEVRFSIRGPCNYACDYCIGGHVSTSVIRHDLGRLEDLYSAIGPFIFTVFECGAGEPTIHPQVKEILSICLRYGTVSLPTNNSTDPSKWLPGDSAKGLLLNITYHPDAESIRAKFVEHLHVLKEKGAQINLRFIARPDRIHQLKSLSEFFQAEGFKLEGVPFSGSYGGKKYPESHTEEEKKAMGLCEGSYWFGRLSAEMPIRDFSGIPCLAGYSVFNVSPQTELQRCLYDMTRLDKPAESPQPCIVKNCGCGCNLQELNVFTPGYWNHVRGLSGYPVTGVETRTQDQIFTESKSKYWELMNRYGKTRTGC